ncbi:hypothetical protein HMH01_03375 [Halovulum dunhuangense]|uniref:Flp pilus-assembly TadE/G-like protein n=1 Tax=Halovulum dunhuangense TaxID=1505036 RepID=A0A849KV06_9RHOB|nr:hypothetical protein [Halovulum dunhuangense]NNU79471.1 hypothetical protein [Halovulum dunhuangense]
MLALYWPRKKRLSDFADDESGALNAFVMLLMPLILFSVGLGIDLTKLNAQERYVQGQADLGVLSGLRAATTAEELRDAVRTTVEANDGYDTLPLRDADIVLGTYSHATGFTAADDQLSLVGVDAFEVRVRSEVDFFIIDLFMPPGLKGVQRTAVGQLAPPLVSFALSNCLLSATLLDGVLRPLIGTELDALCQGAAVDVRLTAEEFLGGFATQVELLKPSGSAVTYGDILDTQLPVADVLGAVTGTPVPDTGETMVLADIIYLAPGLRALRAASPLPPIELSVADLAFATAELLTTRVADVGVGLDLGGVGVVDAALTVGDPRQIVLGATPGDPNAVARTAQIQLDLDVIDVAGVFTLRTSIDVAAASATLTDAGNACSKVPGDEVAVFDPVNASLLDFYLEVDVLNLLPQIADPGELAEGLSLIFDRTTERRAFTHAQYQAEEAQEIRPQGFLNDDSITRSLREATSGLLDAVSQTIASENGCNGLLCLVTGVTGTLNALLGQLSSAVDDVFAGLGPAGTLVDEIYGGLVDLNVAVAELELLEVTCGTGRLVK